MTQTQLRKGLLRLLRQPGWTVARVAVELGASYFTVLNWRKGRTNVSNAYIRPLAALIEGEGDGRTQG